ncbi:hypothetical protein N9F34_03490 [Alphaproteobacteria bacterium]|nr:hypothetical protein [Alphaproteobacteria bacterium]
MTRIGTRGRDEGLPSLPPTAKVSQCPALIVMSRRETRGYDRCALIAWLSLIERAATLMRIAKVVECLVEVGLEHESPAVVIAGAGVLAHRHQDTTTNVKEAGN